MTPRSQIDPDALREEITRLQVELDRLIASANELMQVIKLKQELLRRLEAGE